MVLKGILENHLLQDQKWPIGNLIIPPTHGEFYVLLGPSEASSFIQQIYSVVTISRHYSNTLKYISEQKRQKTLPL